MDPRRSQVARFPRAVPIDLRRRAMGNKPDSRLTGVEGSRRSRSVCGVSAVEPATRRRTKPERTITATSLVSRRRDPNANRDGKMEEPMEGHHAPDLLTDRKAGALLLAFLAAVVVVLAVATLPLISSESMGTPQPTGTGRLDR